MSDPIAHLISAMAARPADGLAGWRAGAPVTNRDFLARVQAWHGLLQGRPGRDFALYLDDSIEFGAALLGAWHAGKTVWLSADTLDASCAALRASVDGFLGQFPAALQPMRPAGDCGAAAAAPGANTAPAGALAGSLPAGLAAHLSDTLPALVVFTSGSTGAAQAIPKKLSQVASEVATLERLFGAAADGAAVLATVSHQHIYGLLFKVLWPLAAGRPIHAISIVFPEELAPAIAAGPCVLVASPAHLKRLPAHLDWRAAAATLRAVFSSGGPLAPDDGQAVGRLLGRVPVEVYGSSETGGVAWRQRSGGTGAGIAGALADTADGAAGGAAGDAWLPFPTVSWRLGGDGTLEVRSPHLADDGWLALADRAARCGERRFLLLGRSDRIVKIEEKRISLSAMEAALLAGGLAAEARILVCDAVAGERQRLAAFIVPTRAGRDVLAADGKPALNGRLRAVLAAIVEAVALPRRWRYLERMPVNAQGKTTQAALLALLDGGERSGRDGGSGEGGDTEADVDATSRPLFPHVRELERDLDSEPRRVLLEITAPPELLYFDGHFDVAPILPGVVQTDWAIHYGRRYFDLPPRFTGINALKFQQVIQPDMAVRLELLHDTLKGSLQFRYVSEAGQHASGRVMLEQGAKDA